MNPRVLLLLPAAVLTLSAMEVREEILVAVNNHIITRRTFQQAVEQEAAALYREFSGKVLDDKLRDTRDKVLQGLIDSFLLQDKATDLGITISDDEIRQYVDGIKKKNNFNSDADFEKVLRSEMNVSLPEFLKRVKENEIQSQVLGQEVWRKIAVEDQEIRQYYDEHQSDYRQPNRFHIRELVLSKGATPDDAKAAREQLAAVQKELAGGKGFEEMVKAYSVSPSKATGGDLGWIGKGIMRPVIEAQAFKLQPGQVGEPLETDKDIMLIQLVAAEQDVVTPLAEVREQIRQKLADPKAENAKSIYMSNLRTRGNIRFLVPKDQILKG